MNILPWKIRGNSNLLSETRPAQRQHNIHLLWKMPYWQIGLGDLIKQVTRRFGIQACDPCSRRAERLNQILVFSGGASQTSRLPNDTQSPAQSTIWTRRFAFSGSNPCWHYHGACTGFGKRQCVTAPASQKPDAVTITRCCNGWFQYPWIEVCPGQPARSGCGTCFW